MLEAKHATRQASLTKAPADVPDLHPNIAELYRRKEARLWVTSSPLQTVDGRD